jgi:hypothetical protein
VPSRPVWSRTSEVPSSVLLHLWAKFRNQTKSVIADKVLEIRMMRECVTCSSLRNTYRQSV